jgi:hypothetical protein
LHTTAYTRNCDSIESDPKNLEATLVLGGIATLLNDNSLLEASLLEIVSLSPQERQQLDRLRKVDALLMRHHLIQVHTSYQNVNFCPLLMRYFRDYRDL